MGKTLLFRQSILRWNIVVSILFFGIITEYSEKSFAQNSGYGENSETCSVVGVFRTDSLPSQLNAHEIIVPLPIDPIANTKTLIFEPENRKKIDESTQIEWHLSHKIAFLISNVPEDECRLLEVANNRDWSEQSFFEVALIAEGLENKEQRFPYLLKMNRLCADITEQIQPITDPWERLRRIFELMHQLILTGDYEPDRSCVTLTLDRGIYNCVSATIIFNHLAGQNGYQTLGLVSTGHAKSRIVVESEYLDIETTCTNWLKLPDRPQTNDLKTPGKFHSYSVGRPIQPENLDAPHPMNLSSDLTVENSSPRTMRAVNDVELIATVFYNRGVDYTQSGQFEQAVCAYLKGIVLDGENETILSNLKGTLNNWAIDLVQKEKKFPQALHITEAGLVLDPNFDQFQTNLPLFYKHWISELNKEHRFEEATFLKKQFNERITLQGK